MVGNEMLRTREEGQAKLEAVYIEQLVRPDHLLRKIQKHIDFRFIIDKVKDLYCADNGRPSLDPGVLFKMLFIVYLFGIRSERRLVHEIADNIAYRWFLGLGLSDPVPSVSTIWQNRRRRWKDSELCQEIFDEIVRQCIHNSLVDGERAMEGMTRCMGKTEGCSNMAAGRERRERDVHVPF
jgi:transposase